MANEVSLIHTKKRVSETLSDLRKLFARYQIEDWEPVPAEQGPGYTVRYFRNKVWTEIGSYYQPTKAMNLRVCYQVIDNMFRWESRGVTGIVRGTAFMGGELVTTTASTKESFDEACATLGVEPDASIDEIKKVFAVKVKFTHPDLFQNATEQERKQAEERFKRLQKAYTFILKVKGASSDAR